MDHSNQNGSCQEELVKSNVYARLNCQDYFNE